MSDRQNAAERSVGLLDRLEALARLEPHNLAGLDCDLGAIARVTPNTGLARPQVKDGESAKLDALATGQSLLHTFENAVNRSLGFRLGDACPTDHFVDDVEFNQGPGAMAAP